MRWNQAERPLPSKLGGDAEQRAVAESSRMKLHAPHWSWRKTNCCRARLRGNEFDISAALRCSAIFTGTAPVLGLARPKLS